MNIETAVKNLKKFRKWFGGSGKKYMYSMPEGITHEQISESLKTIIGLIPNILSIDEFCRVTVAANDHMALYIKNRKKIIEGVSEEEKHSFDTYISDLAKAIRKSKKIIRHLQKMEGNDKNKAN